MSETEAALAWAVVPRLLLQVGVDQLNRPLSNDLAQLGDVVVFLDGCTQVSVIIGLDCCRLTPKSSMGAGGAVPQVCDLTQVLREVIFVLGLRSQLQVPAEGVQPHRVGSIEGVFVGIGHVHDVNEATVPRRASHNGL